MEKKKVYWIRFWSPGSFVSESYDKNVKEFPDPQSVEFPDNAYSFTLHERKDVIDGDKTYRGDAQQVGPRYYHPDSKVEGIDEVSKRKDCDILIRNMQNNNWNEVVWSRWDNWPQTLTRSENVVLYKQR